MTTKLEIFINCGHLINYMFIEKRKSGKNIKYYLVYSYRDNEKTKKIRKYLGENLTESSIKNKKIKAEETIKKEIQKISTRVFDFFLKPSEIKKLNKLNNKIKIVHLNTKEWKKFEKDFVYNTNAIEGSRVLKEEVLQILNKSKVKNAEEKETKNVAKAIEYIHNNKNKEEFDLKLIKKLHNICFKGTKSFAGKFRVVEVVIKDPENKIIHKGVPAKEVEIYLKEMIDWYKKNKNKFKPLILAGIIHNQFENIHPFRDGNGRIGRLLLNFILLKSSYPPINILLEDRGEYYYVLQKYSNDDEIELTIKFLIEQYKKTLK